MYKLEYGGKTCNSLGLIVMHRPSIPAPVEKYTEVEIPGRDGTFFKKEKTYNDLPIEVELNFKDTPNKWAEAYRAAKKWILNQETTNKLQMPDDQEYFLRVKKAEIIESERLAKVIGKIKVQFICEPYFYLNEGEKEVALKSELFNNYEKTEPIYRIVGEGFCTIVANGNTVKVNVGQEIIVNTKLGLCYKGAEVKNINMVGKFDDLKLNSGTNTFSWTNGFNIYVIPNWRSL